MSNNKKSVSVKKAATVVLALGVEQASQVYKFLREEEIELLTKEIALLQNLTTETLENTMDEFYNLCMAQKVIMDGGLDYAKAVLEKAMGAASAAGLIDRVTRSLQTRVFDFLPKADPKHLLSLIQNEHPQTIALILSYSTTEQAATVLSELPRDIQLDVVERIALMDSTNPEVVKDVERMIERKLSMGESMDFTEIGGIKYMAEILNSVDRSTEKFILEELGKRDPKLTEELRNRMFIFEDIASLEPMHIQRFLQEVTGSNMNDLVIALKGTSEEIAAVFYSNMSQRMKETVMEETKLLRGVRMTDVEEAQQKLVAMVRRLEEAGEIFISRGRRDEIIV